MRRRRRPGAALTVDGNDVDIAIETEPTAMETAFDDVAVDSFAASDGDIRLRTL